LWLWLWLVGLGRLDVDVAGDLRTVPVMVWLYRWRLRCVVVGIRMGDPSPLL
jgi:hypothetical protein